MTKLEAVTRRLVDRAVEGDPREIGQLLSELHKNEAAMDRGAGSPRSECRPLTASPPHC